MPIDLSKLSEALKAAITTTGTISSRLPLPSAFIGLLLRSRSSRLHKIGRYELLLRDFSCGLVRKGVLSLTRPTINC
jgi:hypothetical protein